MSIVFESLGVWLLFVVCFRRSQPPVKMLLLLLLLLLVLLLLLFIMAAEFDLNTLGATSSITITATASILTSMRTASTFVLSFM
jgi:hypothetical protein